MLLSLLAQEIYRVLQPMVPSETALITYAELAESIGPLPPPYTSILAGDPRLDEALAEIVQACYANGLPPLSALVVNKAGEKQGLPNSVYFSAAHPDMSDETEQLGTWGNDADTVRRTMYPAVLAS